jgi:hypothetical protein
MVLMLSQANARGKWTNQDPRQYIAEMEDRKARGRWITAMSGRALQTPSYLELSLRFRRSRDGDCRSRARAVPGETAGVYFSSGLAREEEIDA